MNTTDRMLKTLKPRPQNLTPIATDLFVPNHSGDGSHLIKLKLDITDEASISSNFYPVWVKGNSGQQDTFVTSLKFSFNPSLGKLTVSYIDGLHNIVEDASTDQNFPVLFGNGVSSWSYLYGTVSSNPFRWNPHTGELSAPYFVGDGSLLTNAGGLKDEHVICKGYEWRDDTSNPPNWYDTGFRGADIGYTEFPGYDNDTNNKYVHFVLEIPDTFNPASGWTPWFYVNFATTDTYSNGDRFAWRIDWAYSEEGVVFTTGQTVTDFTTSGSGDAWTDLVTDEAEASPGTSVHPRGKFVCRLTRDINSTDTATDTDTALLVIGMIFKNPK